MSLLVCVQGAVPHRYPSAPPQPPTCVPSLDNQHFQLISNHNSYSYDITLLIQDPNHHKHCLWGWGSAPIGLLSEKQLRRNLGSSVPSINILLLVSPEGLLDISLVLLRSVDLKAFKIISAGTLHEF